MKKYLLAIIPVLIIVVFLVLTTEYKNSIIGKWKAIETNDEYYYIFNEDKSCSYEMNVARLDCTYEIDDTNLTILYDGNKNASTYKYKFDKHTLVITDNSGKDNKFVLEKE